MKIQIKNLALFIVLSVVFSSLVGCSNSSDAPSSPGNTPASGNGQAVKTADSGSSGSKAKSDYPELSPEIMQADLKSLDATNFKLEDYKGKVVLVNFWATWCGPCKAEMPELVKLREENKDKGFEVIGVNTDPNEDAELIKTFGEKMKLTYKLAQGEEAFFEEFLKISKFTGIPQSFLIDREGRLNGVYLGGARTTLAKLKDDAAKLLATN